MAISQIVTNSIATGAVSAADLADGSVTAAKLASGVGGKVLQVVSATRTASFVTSSTSFVGTGLTASITPSATSSKILVLIHSNMDSGNTSRQSFMTLVRNGSNLGGLTEGFGANQSGSYVRATASISYLDSPSSTSSVTYELYARSSDGNNVEVPAYASMRQSIILMEIAA